MHLIEAYERMGGEAVIRRLVDRFYDLMDEDGRNDCGKQQHAD